MPVDLAKIYSIWSKLNEPWNTWYGTFIRLVLCFFACPVVVDYAIKPYIRPYLQSVHNSETILNNLPLFLFLIVLIFYLVVLVYHRSWLRVRTSKKVNVVFAYNLESIDYGLFYKKYQKILKRVEVEMLSNELSDIIKIVMCPPNIKIKSNTAAEAKTLLGLENSTILVWGDVVKQSGFYLFRTKISYEFNHPKELDRVEAKKIFSQYIDKIIASGLLKQPRGPYNPETYTSQIYPLVLFVIGITMSDNASMSVKSLIFLKKFLDYYRKVDIIRQKELNLAMIEIKKAIVKVNSRIISGLYSYSNSSDNYEKILKYASELLEFEPTNYQGLLCMASASALLNDIDSAEYYTKLAEKNSPNNAVEHIFNKAFLCLYSSDFFQASLLFLQLPKQIDGYIINSVLVFYEKYFNNTKDEKYFFALNYIRFKWLDSSKKSKNQFKKICKKVSEKLFFVPFKDEIEQLIRPNNS